MNPDQIKKLIDSGKLTPEHIALFTPQEKAVYDKLSQEAASNSTEGMSPSAIYNRVTTRGKKVLTEHPLGVATAIGGAALGGGLASGLGGGLTSIGSKIVPYGKMAGQGLGMAVGAGVGTELLKKIGIPSSMADLIVLTTMLGAGRGKPGMATAEEAGALTAAERAGLAERGYTDPNLLRKIEQAKLARQPQTKIEPSKFARRKPEVSSSMLDEAERNVFGSGGAAAESRAFGTKPPPYPSNISTGATMDDIAEMITRSSSTGAPSPLMVHNGDKELEAAIRKVKNIKRRAPK